MANPLITNIDRSKVFLGNDNRYKKIAYTNSTGSEVTLPIGRVMGRKLTDLKVTPQVSTATDGSEMPRFVLADTYVVANGATVNLTVCYAGDIAQEKLVFNGSDTVNTVLDEYMTSPATDYDRRGTLGDLLIANSHICLVESTEMTNIDNPQA